MRRTQSTFMVCCEKHGSANSRKFSSAELWSVFDRAFRRSKLGSLQTFQTRIAERWTPQCLNARGGCLGTIKPRRRAHRFLNQLNSRQTFKNWKIGLLRSANGADSITEVISKEQ